MNCHRLPVLENRAILEIVFRGERKKSYCLKEMIGIMGLTMLVSSQSPVIAAEASSAKLLLETQISNVQTYAMPTEEQNKELYEALCEGKSVCAGIARAVNLLMNRAGISSYYGEKTIRCTVCGLREKGTEQITLIDGWRQDDDGNTTYIKGGELVQNQVLEIDGNYYGFDKNAIMYVNQSFNMYKSDNGVDYVMACYRAKEDGRIYVNEWYEYDKYDNRGHGSWYYYGDEGKAASGLTQINGTLYYFSEDGRLYQNQTIAVDGKIYYCNLDGIAVELQNNRWTKVDGKYHYVKDGQVLTNCVEKIGDFYYGFDSDGYMFADEQFDLLDSESGNTCYYRAYEDGHLYRNEWYMNYKGLWHYFGDDANMYFGLRFLIKMALG